MIDAERFWKHCMLLDDSADTCWVWVGALREDGLGRVFIGHRGEVRAHRVAYELRFGEPPPKGRELVRTCNHPQCVRHWILGRVHQKLTAEDRSMVRQSWLPCTILARKLGVKPGYIHRLRAGRTTETVIPYVGRTYARTDRKEGRRVPR